MNDFFTKLKKFFCSLAKSIKSFFIKIASQIKNFFLRISEKVKIFFKNFSEKIKSETKTQNQTNQTNQNAQGETLRENSKSNFKTKNQESSAKVSKKVGIFFLNFFDVFFEIVFFCGIFFLLRPDFLSDEKLSCVKNFSFEGFKIFAFIQKDINFTEQSNFSFLIICTIFIIYFLYKFIISLTIPKRFSKIVSALLVAMILVSLLLLCDKFLIFLIFYILLFFAFQFSCGINFKTSRIKFIIILILSFVSYIILLYVFSDLFKNLISCLYKEMKLHKTWF